MIRGTLNNASNDSTLSQMPGQAAAARTIDNSRGLVVRVTSVLSSNLVNVAGWGYTRFGSASTGNQNVVPGLFFSNLIPTTRPSQRVSPTTNHVLSFSSVADPILPIPGDRRRRNPNSTWGCSGYRDSPLQSNL